MAERKNVPHKMFINDPDCAALGCRATWGFGNQLLVFAGKTRTQAECATPAGSRLLHEVVWDTDMHSPIARKLVNEAHSIFLNLQLSQKDPTSKKTDMLKFSREYRSVIKACTMHIKTDLGNQEHKTSADNRQLIQLATFDIIELIWSLCEILFIDTLPAGIVLAQLLDWLHVHFVQYDQLALTLLNDDAPEVNPNYWNVVYSFVLQGRTSDAIHLLSTHPAQRTPAFTTVVSLLRNMPHLLSNQLTAEFEMRWRHWQEQCQHRLEDGEFASDVHMETICRILSGEDEVFVDQRDVLGNWYCLLISRLLYQHPTVKSFDLQYHTQFCIDVYGGHSAMQPADNIILACIEYDIHHVIKESSTAFGNWWFVAHIADLLHHCDKLESQTLYFGATLREFLLLEYASSLMSHHSLWQVAVSYLDCCPQFGRQYMELFIERLPIETEKKAQKVLHVCEQRNMQEQVRTICKVMGMQSLHKGRLGSALSWGLRSKDVNFASFLAEHFLNEYSQSGHFSSLDLIDNLGPAMLLCSKLAFLGKYREFHQLYAEHEFRRAASLLLSLLTARIAPKKFWEVLLTDALPLLEADEVIFSSQQTYELMHCLEEIHIAEKLHPQPKSAMEDSVETEKLNLMKLALARNLARAIVQERSVQPV